MIYNEISRAVGDSKLAKVLGWIFLVLGIMVFISAMESYLKWNSKNINYNKEYVYSEYGTLYYETNGNNVYVDKIYNTDEEIISLDIPNKETVVMYCNKDNRNECIYFDENDSIDKSMQNPILVLFVSLFLISFALFFIYEKRSKKVVNNKKVDVDENTSLSSIYLFYVFLFLLGCGFVGLQVYNAVNYFSLRNSNNITEATIYSEMYNIGASKNKYKSISYYYVDNQKYIYVNDEYENGNLEENLGKTFELYYNKNNPNKVSKKKNPVDLFILLVGIVLLIFSFPFVFFKKKIEKRLDKVLSSQNDTECKI